MYITLIDCLFCLFIITIVIYNGLCMIIKIKREKIKSI